MSSNQFSYRWQDTNMAMHGSDLERKIKEASAGRERAWDGLGARAELLVWRVEQFKLKKWPARKYGQFHEGDSYVIYHAQEKEETSSWSKGRSSERSSERSSRRLKHERSSRHGHHSSKHEHHSSKHEHHSSKHEQRARRGQSAGPALTLDVYIWIGETSSADEYGTAAYKMTELGTKLGRAAVHHREIMEHESKRFMALFENVTYLAGGVDSGFNHVVAIEDAHVQPRLFQVKGVRGALVLREVRCRRDALNSGDVFVLDLQHKLFVWQGRNANPFEKGKAQTLVRSLVADRAGRCQTETLDENQGDLDVKEFWDCIPGERRFLGIKLRTYDVRGELQGGDDAKVKPFRKVMYRLSDASGSLKFQLVARGSKRNNLISHRKLTSDDSFVVDDGFVVWAYVGEKASPAERSHALTHAVSYLRDHKRPSCMPVTRVNDGNAPSAFDDNFEYLKRGSYPSCTIM